MTTIIAGAFDNIAQADIARAELVAAYGADAVAVFHLNPAGQHDRTPIGGDADADAGAKDAHQETLKGAAFGGAVGLGLGGLGAGLVTAAAGPVAGALAVMTATAVGAYTGSLVGTLEGLDGDATEAFAGRKAGVLVGVHAGEDASQHALRDLFLRAGAREVEIAHGTIVAGEWRDFDPLREPVYLARPGEFDGQAQRVPEALHPQPPNTTPYEHANRSH